MDFKKDYYQVLGIARNAQAEEIKSAYRTLAKKHHPDLHPGDRACDERIKAINEAYEVLGSNDNRLVYDLYHADQPAEPEVKREARPKPEARNQRRYTRKVVVTTEHKIYLKGDIFIKYRGVQNDNESTDVLKEVVYDLRITDVQATVKAGDIFRDDRVPSAYEAAFVAEKLAINLPLPIRVKVIYPAITRYYDLEMLDLTIPALGFDNVTKDDGDSFGMLKGVFYGYVKQIDTHEEETEVTECYGESGRRERKTEGGINYHRREYFKNDCSTYWGNWVAEYVAAPSQPVRKTAAVPQTTGCLSSVASGFRWLLLLCYGIFLLFHLRFILPFLLIALLFWLISVRSWTWLFRALGLVMAALFFIALVGIWTRPARVASVVKDQPRERRPRKTAIKDTRQDSLITYDRSWKDYDGRKYDGSYSIRKSDFTNARYFKNDWNGDISTENGYDELLYNLKEHDKEKLAGLYRLLDSVKTRNNFSAEKFAECIVAMVQDIPYALVLPKDCDPSLYADQFISRYLVSAKARCDPNEKFGINTPVEFLATLNGDCDTRTLLLYTVLAHYDYDVALLSSEHYSHSIIGINLPYDGAAYIYQGKKYTLWETTSFVKPGILPNEIANLDYWRISLKSTP